jgi:uridylate kinase
MESDVIIKATKVSGVYTADPVQHPDATFLPRVSFHDVVAKELAVMDAPAVSLCKENGLPIIVLNLSEIGAVAAAIRGEPVGTLVS